jgi:hypothetical protein
LIPQIYLVLVVVTKIETFLSKLRRGLQSTLETYPTFLIIHRFWRWRLGKSERIFNFEAAVKTHSDNSRHPGLKQLFEHQNVNLGTVFHNGIVENIRAENLAVWQTFLA